MTMKLKLGFSGGDGQIFFSTADIGWLNCFSHSIYGPLLWGGTSVVLVGIPFYPSYFRIFDAISRSNVTHIYTARTVIRMFQKNTQENNLKIDEVKKKFNLSSVKLLGIAGELPNEGSKNFFRVFD